MKKNYHLRMRSHSILKKLIMELKVVILIVLVSASNIFALNSYSQTAKVTLDIENKTLEQVMDEIEQQSEFYFIFNQNQIDVGRIVNIEAEDKLISEILPDLFKGIDINYSVEDRKILLTANPLDTDSEKILLEIASQQSSISGTVTDAATGDPLPGVTVMVKGTTLGTLSDGTGKFSITIPGKEAILVFSFIGYQSQEIIATPGAALNVSMSLEVTQIEEVVVVGYSTQKKESVVGAIAQIDNATLIQSAAPTVTTAIAGKLSGVLTIQQTGLPGSSQAEIIIRGESSWSGSAPLILIDGVERDFKDMDPNEINTISVLKDASATAVFGSRGANGVIIVTTKRGSTSKPKMTFTGSAGMEIPTRVPDFIDSYTTLSMLNVAKMNGQMFSSLTSRAILNEYRNPSTPLKALQYPSVDWFKLLTKPFAPTANGNINVVGGTDFVKYFLSLGYLYQGSLFDQAKEGYWGAGYWYHRFNFRSNLDFTLTKTTTVSLNIGGEEGLTNQPIQGEGGYSDWKSFYGAAVSDYPAYYPAWVLEEIPDTDYPDATGIRRAYTAIDWITNPWSNVNKGTFERYQNIKLFTDLILEEKLDYILKGLSVKGKIALNTYYNHRILYTDWSIPSYRIFWDRVGVDENGDGKVDQNPWHRQAQGTEFYRQLPMDINVGGMAGGYYTTLYSEGSLNYGNTFGKHTVTGLALIHFQQNNQGTAFPYYNEALVGRVTYDYWKKYLLEINLGYTGSERFAPGNRFGFFPSGAVGWVVSEENFFKNAVPWMNKLKIRYSQGLVGSDYAANRWLYMSDYYLDYKGYITEDKGANVNAQWEEARKRDLGIEIGVFKNLFTLSVDLFDEKRSKMLLTPQSVTMLIGNSFKDLNLGSLKKHGIEIEAEYKNKIANNFNYFLRGNFGFSENRILFKDDPIYAPEYTKAEGKPLGARTDGVTRTGTGFYTTINDIHNNPSPVLLEKLFVGDYKFLDYNADGTISRLDNHPIKGQYYAPVVYSFSGGFSYKGFDLNVMFQGNYGKYIQMSTVSEVEFYYLNPRVHESAVNYWRPDNQNATHATLHYSGSDTGDAIYSWGGVFQDLFWRNASYLRLKEVYAGYNIKSNFLNRSIGISSMIVYANATNLLTFTKLIKEWDPEIKTVGGGWYPQLGRINLGIKVAF